MTSLSLSESDLQAYVDLLLSDERRQEITQWLAVHPEDLARVQAYQAQITGLRQLFDPVLDEPIPAALHSAFLDLQHETQDAARTTTDSEVMWWQLWSLQRVAASFAFAIMFAAGGGLAGWSLHAHQEPALALNGTLNQGAMSVRQPQANLVVASIEPVSDSLPHRAIIAHSIYTPDIKRPVELGSDQEEQLVKWLSKRLGSTLRPPKLTEKGFELVGGRLLPGSSGPVAQFMYQNASGLRLTLYASNENKNNKDTGFRYLKEGQTSAFYWIDGEFGYALSGNLEKEPLSAISLLVFEQLEQR